MADEQARREPAAPAASLIVKRLLREPLVHFLVLGGVLFGGYSLLERDAGGEDASPTEIRADASTISRSC